MNLSKIKLALIIICIGLLVVILSKTIVKPKSDSAPTNTKTAQQSISPNDKPQIISTKPDPLDNTIISVTEIIEITFNKPLENIGEFKFKIDPKIDYKIELSSDRKTAKIIPVKPYSLGSTYTIFIGPETKFDGTGRWGEEKVFHYRTIKYTGV